MSGEGVIEDVSRSSVHARTRDELESGLDDVRAAPADVGRIDLIVRRPDVERREVIEEAVLDLEVGLVGDNWKPRGSRSSPDGRAKPAAQLTLMNARSARLICGGRDAWPIAGDQFYVDFDLSVAACPAGTRLMIGTAVIEVTDLPHTGCAKFARRFGEDALRVVNSPEGRALNLRGVNARIVEPGVVRQGDTVRRSDAVRRAPSGARDGE